MPHFVENVYTFYKYLGLILKKLNYELNLNIKFEIIPLIDLSLVKMLLHNNVCCIKMIIIPFGFTNIAG